MELVTVYLKKNSALATLLEFSKKESWPTIMLQFFNQMFIFSKAAGFYQLAGMSFEAKKT